jgi:eukaryotic-like serine/threonine-protein kinase
VVLYEALAGRHPVRASGPAATARRIGTVLPSLGRARKDLPAPLVAAVDRALRPRPAERGDLDDLAEALEDALPAVSDDGGTIAPLPFEDEPLPRSHQRAAAALAAGVLTGAVLAALTAEPPAHPALLGVAAALAVLALPRLGWIAAAAGVVAAVGVDEPGTAGMVLFAAAVSPLSLLAAPVAWSVPAGAVGLGLAGVAAAFPALAGRARRWTVRAGLGAAGAAWLLIAAPLGEPALLLDLGDGVTPRAWALVPLWAGAAVLLGWLVRGRHLALDLVAAVSWSAGLTAATASLAAWMGLPEPRGLVPAAVLAALLALWARR